MSETEDYVYVVKYALTAGIKRRRVLRRDYGGYVVVGPVEFYRLGTQCANTLAEAIAIAERMRVRKVVSLRRQLVAMQAMTFDVREMGISHERSKYRSV